MAHGAHPSLANHIVVTPDFNHVYSKFSASVDAGALPANLIEAARINVYDTLACSIAGFRAPGVQEVLGVVEDWGGKEQAQVLWSKLRAPAPNAAWINGIMAHACDYDDTHDKAILHAGISVLPAAIAAAEIAGRPISGREFYSGVITGLELTCRIGMASRIGLIQAGFIFSALLSYFGATTAAARVLNMSAEDTANAVGIAYTQASGTHQVTRDGALTKRMQPGFGARAALTSIAMAQRGVRGAQNIYEGIDGLNRTYLQSELDSDVLRKDLGSLWHFADLSYKPYPCCRMNHCAIDAALALRQQPGFDWRKVSEIRAYINSQGNQAVGVPIEIRRAPQQVVQAQFSICYTIASALITGRVGLSDFDAPALKRPDLLSLAAKVTPIVDADFERRFGRNVTPARVEAVIDGETFSAEVLDSKGSPGTPMSQGEMRRKLEDCLSYSGFNPKRADLFEEIVSGLDHSKDVAADIRRLSAGVIAG